jgi:membrane associated rhomboid family serine protease
MTPTSVGMRCPECSRERTRVRTVRSLPATPVVTQALIAVNAVVFLAEAGAGASLGGGGGGVVFNDGALYGPLIAHQHEYWRIVTSGFLHAGLFHILVNMLSMYFLGRVLEPAIGRLNFAAVYFASLLAGSFGALLFEPLAPTVGASTAIFGIFGALIVVARSRGIPLWQSGLGPILLVNLIFSVLYSRISIGGHLGGLVAGLITGALVVELAERRHQHWLAVAGCAAVAALSVAGAISVAGLHGLTPNGIGVTG